MMISRRFKLSLTRFMSLILVVTMLCTMYTPAVAADNSLRISTSFNITRPTEKISTYYTNYFITGTSDPSKPVYFGSTEIERQGSLGTFGVYVSLAMGDNKFTFSQDGENKTVVITRTSAPGTGKIKAPVQSSIIPAIQSAVKVGDALTVGCTAPAGAKITATFDGQSVTLNQKGDSVKTGYPVAYTGKITVDGDDYDPDRTEKAGKVTYSVTYNGETKKYTSSGDVYVAGKNAELYIEVTEYLGFVYNNKNNDGNFKETVKAGARDYITGQDNEYYYLASGGYMPKDRAGAVSGKGGVNNKISAASFSKSGRVETVTISGSRRPIYDTKIADNTFYLTLYNSSGTAKPDVSGSKLMSGCSVSESDGAVTYKFPLSGRVWGFDVSFGKDNNILLTMRSKPTSSSSSQPLEGSVILLDPGHGGDDPGALGVAGKLGPNEAEINLAHAQAIKSKLEKLGAEVIMTRDDDTRVELDERMEMIEATRCDMFISVHHNSIGESTDANKVRGMEIYYHTSLSKSFANNMMDGLTSGTGRTNRFVSQSYYRVTLMYNTPALLLELGFLSNPLEYEKATTKSEIDKVAQSVADGVVKSLS